HWRMDNPGKCAVVFFSAVMLACDLSTCCTQQRAARLGITCGAADGIARCCARVLCNSFALTGRDVFRHWVSEGAVVSRGYLRQASHCRRGSEASPSITTAPTYSFWSTRKVVSLKKSVHSTSLMSKRRSGLSLP